jgi:hypothetical protein
VAASKRHHVSLPRTPDNIIWRTIRVVGRFGLADDDEYVGFDMNAAMASLAKKTHLHADGIKHE